MIEATIVGRKGCTNRGPAEGRPGADLRQYGCQMVVLFSTGAVLGRRSKRTNRFPGERRAPNTAAADDAGCSLVVTALACLLPADESMPPFLLP